jgi:hypothetical protein
MGMRPGRRVMALVAAVTGLVAGAAPAEAAVKLCISPHAVVPENPSVVVPVAALGAVRASDEHGRRVPFRTRRLSDYFVWLDLEAADGAALRVTGALGGGCSGSFRRLTVSRAYRAERRPPTLLAVSRGSSLGVTLRRPQDGWLKTEWAYSRAELEAGDGAIHIAPAPRGAGLRAAHDLAVADDGRLLYVRFTSLLPDGGDGGVWSGWIDPRRGTFGELGRRSARSARASRGRAACPTGGGWTVPDTRVVIDGEGQRRFRAVDGRGRVLPTRLTSLGGTGWELRTLADDGDRFWLQELPASGGVCHGPMKLSTRLDDQPPVLVEGATEIASGSGDPAELHLRLRRPSLWWELHVEWAPTESALRAGDTRRRVFRATEGVILRHGEDVPADLARLYLEITPRHADGSHGPTFTGRLVRGQDGGLEVARLR